jgi:HD-GYP domain-containing protein (c-di-GMP phosphodiesterase class II)
VNDNKDDRKNKDVKVLMDIYDCTGRIVVKNGALVNFQLVHKLMEHGRKAKKTLVSFGQTPLFKDFRHIFNEEKYFTIFTPYKTNEEIADVTKDVTLTKEIFEELKGMEERFPYTFRHTLLVTALTVKLAMDLKDKGYNPKHAAIAGLFHDLGKTRIPKQLLGKDSPLTRDEYRLLRTHSLMSYILLCYYLGPDPMEAVDAARDHHETLDGGGYPRGSSKINKYARLITPGDIFDALISERPYRGSPYTIRQALDHLISEANAGKIDKEIVYYLISYVRKEHPKPEELIPYDTNASSLRSDSSYGRTAAGS